MAKLKVAKTATILAIDFYDDGNMVKAANVAKFANNNIRHGEIRKW
jgi:hypothetical protein